MSKKGGPWLVALGASLWATDALVRFPTLGRVPAGVIVLVEHFFGLLALAPLVIKNPRRWLSLRPSEWAAAAFVGALGSALATLLFTSAFALINPSVVILLQKTQPLFAIAAAALFLGERPSRSFFGWAFLAIAAGLVLSFPDFELMSLIHQVTPSARGTLLALGAAALWGLSTVVGKRLLARLDAESATFARLMFGFLTLLAVLPFAGLGAATIDALQTPRFLAAVVYMGWVPGLLALWLYYKGLKSTPAGVATIVELVFPLMAVVINWAFLGMALSAVQIAAGIVLLIAITRVTR